MNRVLLSASMIVRNEARHLEDCLRSLEGVVDETVVVDTGSTDSTKDIARDYGTRLYEFAWCGDFAAARNEALSRAQGAWILYVDADERVRRAQRSELEALLRKRWRMGYYVQFHAKTGFTPYWEMRLFRRHPALRFEGAIHENIWPALMRHNWFGRLGFGYSDLLIDHVGYDGDQSHKYARDLPMLEQAVVERPDHVYCWYHLGTVYRALNRPTAARAAWLRGIEAARARGYAIPQDALAYMALIQHDLDSEGDVEALLDEAEQLFPRNPHLLWLRGREHMRHDHHDAAVACFDRLVATAETGDYDMHLGYNRRLFDAWPSAGSATCRYNQGRYAEAERLFAAAERASPETLEYRVKRSLCAKFASRSGCGDGA